MSLRCVYVNPPRERHFLMILTNSSALVALVFAGMHVSNKHNTVRSGCGASSSVHCWLPPFPLLDTALCLG